MDSTLTTRALRPFKGILFPTLMLTLALGTVLAFFSFYNELVLKPLPFKGSDRLVYIDLEQLDQDGSGYQRALFYLESREMAALSGLIEPAFQIDARPLRVEAGGHSSSHLVAYATPNLFTALGLLPSAGRLFAEGDPEPGVVLSHDTWRTRSSEFPLNSTVVVDGVPLVVLGVAPPGFNKFQPGQDEPTLYMPFEARARSGPREAKILTTRELGTATYARLHPGISPNQLQSALGPLAEAWRSLMPVAPKRLRPHVQTLAELRGDAWRRFVPGGTLLGVATLALLLVAALNLGSLQVARWLEEREELAIRMALGAPLIRLVGSLSAPMMATLALAGVGAWPLAWALGQLLSGFAPPSEFPVTLRPALDLRVLGLAFALIAILALSLLLFAWIWFLRHPNRPSTHRGGPKEGMRWRKILLGFQLALSVMLLGGTLSSLQMLHRATRIPLGLSIDGLQTVSFALPTHLKRAAILDVWIALGKRFQERPDIEATCVLIPPCEAFNVPHKFLDPEGNGVECYRNIVAPGTFNLLGLPLLRGQDFSETDTATSEPVAVISVSAARALCGREDPLGKTIQDEYGKRTRIVGLLADHRWVGPLNPQLPYVYLSNRQRLSPLQTLIIRSHIPNALFRNWIEEEVGRLDPRLGIVRDEPLKERLHRQLQPQRLAATLFGILGLTALVLAIAGQYSLQRQITLQRLPEAGLRMALGGTPSRIMLGFLKDLRLPIGLGLSGGILASFASWRVLSGRVPGLPPLDWTVLLWILLGLLATCILASLIPALRILKVHPAQVLRRD